MKCNDFSLKVFVEDTDFQGFVYHANYLKYFERARSQFLIDNHQLFNQFKAIKLWFEKVEKTKYTPSYFFPKQNYLCIKCLML